MTTNEIRELVKTEKYDFLRTDTRLNDNIILLGLGGSMAYGTNVETSDVDIRGIALNSKQEVLLGSLCREPFEQVVDVETDTVVYSFYKIISLLMECNPNTIEMLGCKPDSYIYVSDIGKKLIENRDMFLSKRAFHTFGGYANQQLYRLNQKAAKNMHQTELEEHILRTLQNMQENFKDRYTEMPEDGLKLYIDKSDREDMETEIFMDLRLTHYPVRDWRGMWSEFNTTVKSYNKLGKRNKNAIEHDKLSKHMMHLVRLYYMCYDILEKKEINTYREKEHDFLMSIRDGIFLDENDMPTVEFLDLVSDLENKLNELKDKTTLPDVPDYERIAQFVCEVNEQICRK